MKRGTIVGLVVAGVLVAGLGGAVLYASTNASPGGVTPVASPDGTEAASPADDDDRDDGGAASPAETPRTTDGGAGTDSDDAASTAGAYVEYSAEALAAAEGTRVLFFHATWCPQCRALDDDIVAEGVPDGITVLKVDYDTNQDLRQRYDVVQQTTVVALDDSGAAVASFVPYSDPTLANALAGLGFE